MGVTSVKDSLQIPTFHISSSPHPYNLLNKLQPFLCLKQHSRTPDGLTIFYKTKQKHPISDSPEKCIRPAHSTVPCIIQSGVVQRNKLSSMHQLVGNINKNDNKQQSCTTASVVNALKNEENHFIQRNKRNKSGIQCKSKLFRDMLFPHTDRIVSQSQRKEGKKISSNQYVLKILNHTNNDEYDRSVELLALLSSKKINNLKDLKGEKSKYNACLIQFDIIHNGIFCDNSSISINLLFQHYGSHTLKDQIQLRKTSQKQQNSTNKLLHNSDEQPKPFSVVELVQITKFLLHAAEQSIKNNHQLLTMQDIYGRNMFNLIFSIDHVIMCDNNQMNEEDKKQRYKYRNLIDSVFFYANKKIEIPTQQQPMTNNTIFNSACIFSIGLCLMSCCLLQDIYEYVVNANGQICRSVLQDKIQCMRERYSDELVCQFIEMLVTWPFNQSSKTSQQQKQQYDDSYLSNSHVSSRFKPNIESGNWLQQVKKCLRKLMQSLRNQEFTKYKTKQLLANSLYSNPDILKQDMINQRPNILGLKSKFSCPSQTLSGQFKGIINQKINNDISQHYGLSDGYKNNEKSKTDDDISVLSLYTTSQNGLKQIKIHTNNNLNIKNNNLDNDKMEYQPPSIVNHRKQNDINYPNMKKKKIKQPQGVKVKNGKTTFTSSSAFKNKKIYSRQVIEKKQEAIREIDQKWKMEESMFKNMPEFQNFNSQVFAFNVKPELDGKIQRKLSAIELTLLSHRD